ncbi:MAG TPA: nuclear transport factor 2 family protein [Acidimicrobiales bacterium]
MTSAAADIERAVDAYFAAWNERDDGARQRLLDSAITDDCELTGPTGTFRGRDAILRLIVALQGRMGDAVTVRSGPVAVEEDDIRFPWQVRSSGGDSLLGGVDVVQMATDGRLARIAVAI